MRKHITWFFSALLFLCACRGNTPKGIIDRDDMVRLLAEVHIVDGSLYNQAVNDSLYKYGTDRYAYVFKQFHTDSTQFKRSVKYYTTQSDELMKMYIEVGRILQKKSDSLTKVRMQEAEKTRKQEELLNKKIENQQKIDTVK